MDVQTLMVGMIVAAAGLAVANRVRRAVLAARPATGGGKNCGAGCGCSHG